MEVYAYEFNSCIYEGGYSVVSLHEAKADAYKAMLEAKRREARNAYEDHRAYNASKGFGFEFYELQTAHRVATYFLQKKSHP